MNDDKQGISSKAPFVGAVVFFGLLLWKSQSPTLPDNPMVLYLNIFQMVIYGFLGVASLVAGVYHLKSGRKTIDPPRTSHIIWSVLALAVITVMGIAVVWYESSNVSPNPLQSDDHTQESESAR